MNEKDKYIREWAKMMITIWEDKMISYDLMNTNDVNSLYMSLDNDIRGSTSDTAIIYHFFNHYGVYVDRGTGREFSKGNEGDLGFTPNREAKPWLDSKFYYYTRKLAEKMAELNQQEAVYIIKQVIEGS